MKEPVPDELDRRLEQALRRRFEPPASLAELPARVLAHTPRRWRAAPWLFLAAVAAAALAWLAPWRGAPVRRSVRPSFPQQIARAPESRALVCRPSGPLESPDGRPERVHSPDLAQLYATMDACQRFADALPCRENEGLAERLQETYGAEIELRPDAVGFLQGPFASADWPTATILTGTSEEHTSVLVAERDATLDCCLCVDLPQDSGLRLFTWQVGDLVLTEITPFDEPRLFQFFE